MGANSPQKGGGGLGFKVHPKNDKFAIEDVFLAL